MELTEAEERFISLLRGECLANFSVEIRFNEGAWYAKLWDHDAQIACHGQGANFSEAWQNVIWQLQQ